jgi:large subunit ribosomal protein L7/L12
MKPGCLMLVLTAAIVGMFASCGNDDPPIDAEARYSVVITAFDRDRMIDAIKDLRAETDLGLADAKRLLDDVPSVVRSGLNRTGADALAARLRARNMEIRVQAE